MDSQLPPDNNPPPGMGATPPPPPPPMSPAFAAPPPVITSSMAPRPARKGGGWKVLAIILFVVLGFSLLLNFGSFVSAISGKRIGTSRGYGPQLEEVTVRDNHSSSKIAVIPIEGVISGEAIDGTGLNLVTLIKEQLKRARTDSDVKAVILKVNSPGGEVLASDEIAVAI